MLRGLAQLHFAIDLEPEFLLKRAEVALDPIDQLHDTRGRLRREPADAPPRGRRLVAELLDGGNVVVVAFVFERR